EAIPPSELGGSIEAPNIGPKPSWMAAFRRVNSAAPLKLVGRSCVGSATPSAFRRVNSAAPLKPLPKFNGYAYLHYIPPSELGGSIEAASSACARPERASAFRRVNSAAPLKLEPNRPPQPATRHIPPSELGG